MIMESTTETQLRQQLEALRKSRVVDARRCATWTGIVSVAAILGFAYGYVQQEKGLTARTMMELATKEKQEALMMRDRAEVLAQEASIAMKRLEQLTIELEICKASKK